MSILLKPNLSDVKRIFDISKVEPSKQYASTMDKQDPLQRFRSEFAIPPSIDGNRVQSIYLCGNSLGCLPHRAATYCSQELAKWSQLGVEGHFRGRRPWATIDEPCVTLIKPIIGASSDSEVAIMNSLSVNNNLLLLSFYRPTKQRYKILIEHEAFCSDHHTVRAQLDMHDLTAKDALIEVKPSKKGEQTISSDAIIGAIEAHKDSIAVVWLGVVQYYTGQLYDVARIVRAAHAYNIYVGLDLAHAVGNVPLRLHDWHVDFATWCSYKYLNSGPGSISGAFVHTRHHDSYFKRCSGWWGQALKDRFAMGSEQVPKRGAQAWQISNPAVLPVVCLQASLELFAEAGMENLRAKSVALTRYLEVLLEKFVGEWVSVITPKEVERRGCQLSLMFEGDMAMRVHKLVTRKGVICDLRNDDVMRIAPTPMYNTFEDVWEFVRILKESLEELTQGLGNARL